MQTGQSREESNSPDYQLALIAREADEKQRLFEDIALSMTRTSVETPTLYANRFNTNRATLEVLPHETQPLDLEEADEQTASEMFAAIIDYAREQNELAERELELELAQTQSQYLPLIADYIAIQAQNVEREILPQQEEYAERARLDLEVWEPLPHQRRSHMYQHTLVRERIQPSESERAQVDIWGQPYQRSNQTYQQMENEQNYLRVRWLMGEQGQRPEQRIIELGVRMKDARREAELLMQLNRCEVELEHSSAFETGDIRELVSSSKYSLCVEIKKNQC